MLKILGGETALHLAGEAVGFLLIKHGADFNIKDKKGKTPCDYRPVLKSFKENHNKLHDEISEDLVDENYNNLNAEKSIQTFKEDAKLNVKDVMKSTGDVTGESNSLKSEKSTKTHSRDMETNTEDAPKTKLSCYKIMRHIFGSCIRGQGKE